LLQATLALSLILSSEKFRAFPTLIDKDGLV
jgi:hypothetical protein